MSRNKKSFRCPNCGSSLESYSSNCPYCNTEIRDIKSSDAINKFTEGLEKIRSKEMPEYSGKESLLKRTLGVDLSKDIEAREEYEKNFREKLNKQVANYIKNYPIPNSKEDLIEFMILVTSNIDSKIEESEEVLKSWIEKMEQIYKKAKLTLKNKNDLKIVEDLYNSKIKDLKNKKIDKAFYISGGVLLYIALIVSILNIMFGLSFLFFSFGIFLLIYYFIKGDKSKLFKTPIIITKKIIKIVLIIFTILAVIFLCLGIAKQNRHPEGYTNYYNEEVKKNNVEVEIDFQGNIFFNKYDVKVSVYDQEVNLPHGENKTFTLKLPDGKHTLDFTGDGMVEHVYLIVKGDTKVKYRVSCHTDEIKVSELSLEYVEETKDETTTTTTEVSKNKIVILKSSSDYINKNYKEVENELKNLGFKNIKLNRKETDDKNNIIESVVEITIDGRVFSANSEYDEDIEINILYWIEKVEPTTTTTTTTTATEEPSKDGNKGVYAYINKGKEYDIYWIIDFDTRHVYNYFEGNGDETCDRLKINSGTLNDNVKITWHDGNDKWSYKLHFKNKKDPNQLVVIDNDGFSYYYNSTNLNDALKIRNKKRVVDY